MNAPKVNCWGIPDTYRGWSIEQGPDDCYYAFGPDYEATLEDEDWTGNGQSVCATTYEDLKDEINNKIEDAA